MPRSPQGHILGIESSCDDTGVSIIDQDGRVLSNCIHSQLRESLFLGGVIPVVAKELHLINIDRIARQALENSKLKSVADDITAIAVTNRPGLDFSLKVGLNYAKSLAKKYLKPIIPVHHMQAHALMPLLTNRSIKFPFLALLISGGHCLFAIAKSHNDFHLIGQSNDIAPGELLDKVSRRLKLKNLGYPFDSISGGASIELLSKRDGANRFKYFNTESSIPILKFSNCDLSFGGYFGSFERLLPRVDDLWASGDREKLISELADICASLQRGILIQLVRRLQRAILYYKMHWRHQSENTSFESNSCWDFKRRPRDDLDDPTVIDVVVSGGVAANEYIVNGIKFGCSQFLETEARVFWPSRPLCSDNGLMIAWNGLLRYRELHHSPDGRHRVSNDINNSVAHGVDQINSIQTFPNCPMGLDIRDIVGALRFKSPRIKHPEFKLIER